MGVVQPTQDQIVKDLDISDRTIMVIFGGRPIESLVE